MRDGHIGDPYTELLRGEFRPRRLPISVSLITTHSSRQHLHRLWSFYALHGVESRSLFDDHHDFRDYVQLPALADALMAILECPDAPRPACSDPLISETGAHVSRFRAS